MTSGIALVVAILSDTSLGLMLILLGSFSAITAAWKWNCTKEFEKQFIFSRLKVGLAAGIIATLGYDLSRLLLVKAANMSITPFEAFFLFGRLIIGENASKTTTLIVGTAYHILNGIMFAVAYCFVLGRKGWQYGIIWALFLEAAMFSLYPGWLDLDAVMREFTIMSVTGHIVYGTILGWLCRYWLKNCQRNISLNETEELSLKSPKKR